MSYNETCRKDFAELAPLMRQINVLLKKVPAHSGIRGNEFADALAQKVTRQRITEMFAERRGLNRQF